MGAAFLERALEDRRIRRAFRYHSRTFSLAARLLPQPVQLPVATLYLYCRHVDTIADRRVQEVGPAQALAELRAAQTRLEATLAGRPPDEFLWQRLHKVNARFDLDKKPLHELIEGAAWDLEGHLVDTREDLVQYANLVGGSVGAMMLPFLIPEPEERCCFESHARSLGIAMQITNIVRDVGEDARRLGRVYLPRTWMADHGLTERDLRRNGQAAASLASYPALLEVAMDAAEEHYSIGFAGVAALPPGVRTGIRAAARMYREIMNEVRALGYDNLRHRAYVPLRRKLRLILQDDYAARKARLLAGRGNTP